MNAISMIPIGAVRSTRTTVFDDDWDRETVPIEIDASVTSEDALRDVQMDIPTIRSCIGG